MFARAPPGDDWHWLRALQGSYHKWAQSAIKQWMNKATKSDSKPPKAKHVRRLIVANLRDREASASAIATYLITERPWRDDPRVAAKCLYIILVLLQYQNRLSEDAQIGALTDKVVNYLIDRPMADERMKLFSQVAQRIGSIIHSKLQFHQVHGQVHGNFNVPTYMNLSELIPDLRRHLKLVLYETNGIQAAVTQSNDFVATVLWQPMVDETVSAYRLLKSIDKDPEVAELLRETEELIAVLPNFPYIATTVIFPTAGEKITIPRERWPKTVE